MKRTAICLTIFLLSPMVIRALAGPVQVGQTREVAPQAAGTRAQTWAAIAWSDQAKCWLVAWREGYLNEESTEVWCARVGLDGNSLDPAGIRIASGKGLRGDVKVASDGQDWLVVWEDLSNGHDWDVWGCLVSANGKPKGQPSMIAGGPHNQCQPAVAFAGDCYHVVWAGFVGSGLPNTPGNGYGLFGTRLSREGTLLDSQPQQLVSNQAFQASHPAIVANQERLMVVFMETGHIRWGSNVLNRVVLDAKNGRVVVGPRPATTDDRKEGLGLGNKVTARWLPIAASRKTLLTAIRNVEGFGGGKPYLATFWTISWAGELRKTTMTADGLRHPRIFYTPAHAALGSDGEHFLYVMESPASRTGNSQAMRMGLVGWLLAEDGQSLVHGAPRGGFILADQPDKEHILPAVCGGPKGVFLVVNSEIRGVDDIKLVARIVKTSQK